MPGIELHADFDRDGRISGNASERAARERSPGAIIVPNLDSDRGPSTSGDDFGLPPRRDDELLPLRVHVPPGSLAPGEGLIIRLRTERPHRFNLFDDQRRFIPKRRGDPWVFELPALSAGATQMPLLLRARTLPGARMDRAGSLNLSYTDDRVDEIGVRLVVQRVDAAGDEIDEDFGFFSVAPAIFDDGLGRARRLYIAAVEENEPSRFDVHRAIRGASVRYVEISEQESNGDSWIQDQFQHASLYGPDGRRSLIINLPRLKKDSGVGQVESNLGTYVDTRLRKQNLALHRDLWEREFKFRDADNRLVTLTFAQTNGLVAPLNALDQFLRAINKRATEMDARWRPIDTSDWFTALSDMNTHMRRFTNVIDAAIDQGGERTSREVRLQSRQADALKASFNDRLSQLNRLIRSVRVRGVARAVVSIDGHDIPLTRALADRLTTRFLQLHRGANYGGNIEATPPLAGAPLGKLVVGNERGRFDDDFMDPELFELLVKQRKQQVVEINTSWLSVGHVDEIMSFVPASNGGFSVLHANSRAAVQLMQRAEDFIGQVDGNPPLTRSDRRPEVLASRRYLIGEHGETVTTLLSGKSWLQEVPRPQGALASTIIEPPFMYRKLAARCLAALRRERSRDAMRRREVRMIAYVDGVDVRRNYRADMTVTDFLWCDTDRRGNSCNLAYDERALAPSRHILSGALEGVSVLPIPVCYDAVEDARAWREAPERQPLDALMPAMTNLQQVNGHLLVPRPFGPRMRVEDAVQVVRQAMDDVQMPVSIRNRVTPQLVARYRLAANYDRWIKRVSPMHTDAIFADDFDVFRTLFNAESVADVFRDFFPHLDEDDVRSHMDRLNGRKYVSSGFVPYEWTRFHLDDGLVDLFELWFVAVSAELGIDRRHLHFVDSWFYHLRSGQIHCGTNVIRDPSPRLLRQWWNLPDTSPYAMTEVDFSEAEEIEVGS